MSSNSHSLDLPFQRLRQVRTSLLRLHKALLDHEKIAYERQYGQIQSRGDFFNLVISHEWFGWLRPFSQFIVEIDEALSTKEPMTLEEATRLLAVARSLVTPSEGDAGGGDRYHQAIQASPDIAFMHAEIANLIDS